MKANLKEQHGKMIRDSNALLKLIAQRLDAEQCDLASGKSTWGAVGDMEYIRSGLMEMLISFNIGPDGSEETARAKIEKQIASIRG